MANNFLDKNTYLSILGSLLLTVGFGKAVYAEEPIYKPKPFPANNEITDVLSRKDIPIDGGFARDYTVTLTEGDIIVIDLVSDQFDTILTLLDEESIVIGENDDGPDGSQNSLLFARITKSGIYTIRVQAYGETIGGTFQLKLTRLRPI